MSSIDKIGMIAGWGHFPVHVATTLAEQGVKVFCLGVHGHSDPVLANLCHEFRPTGIARTGSQIRYFKRHGCVNVTMAGKIFKTRLFKRFGILRHMPDLSFVRCFYPALVKKSDHRDDTLLTMYADYFESKGLIFAPATDFAPELLVKEGNLTRKMPSTSQMKDIQFGWKVAKEMGRLDIGQSVVIKGQTVLAVEAIEGTDECIGRAGQLCKSGGFTVVKVAKPNQDMRFDVPTIGEGTIKTIHAAGGKVLAIEADRTIVLNREATIACAEKLGITLVAVQAKAMDALQVA